MKESKENNLSVDELINSFNEYTLTIRKIQKYNNLISKTSNERKIKKYVLGLEKEIKKYKVEKDKNNANNFHHKFPSEIKSIIKAGRKNVANFYGQSVSDFYGKKFVIKEDAFKSTFDSVMNQLYK